MQQSHAFETPIGVIQVTVSDGAIVKVTLLGSVEIKAKAPGNLDALLLNAQKQLLEYLAGERAEFTLPLNPEGTPFQQRVWHRLLKIPYGETCSYGQIAQAAGNPKASRAVGMANNRNPILLMIPCHRVIGANGKLVGYGQGLPLKERLLNMEKERAEALRRKGIL